MARKEETNMTAEAGHAAARVYMAQDGSFHENSASIYDTAEVAKTVTNAEINVLHGQGVTSADMLKLHNIAAGSGEVNILAGVTATSADLNQTKGLTVGSAQLNRMLGVTPTSGELNILAGVNRNSAQINNLIQGLTSGVKTAGSSQSVTGSAVVTTGLATIVSVTATLGQAPSLASGTIVSVDGISSGAFNLKVYQPAASSDCTPVISSGAAVIHWRALGT
jgi:hypothetical protein